MSLAIESKTHRLPEYAEQLTAFHRAFAGELAAIVGALPITPSMRVIDAGCGDGFYLGLFAQLLDSSGCLVGLDINRACLAQARKNPAVHRAECKVELVEGSLEDLPLAGGEFDLAWCAQSLYSLPDPVDALRQLATAVRPGGLVVVLENDTLHQVLLPWPSRLEIALRAAEYNAFAQQTARPGKYYVGRRLPGVLAAAGLEPLGFRTQCIDRQAPLGPDLEAFLACYLERLMKRVGPRLAPTVAREIMALTSPRSDRYLVRQPYFTMSWLNVLAWGRMSESQM